MIPTRPADRALDALDAIDDALDRILDAIDDLDPDRCPKCHLDQQETDCDDDDSA